MSKRDQYYQTLLTLPEWDEYLCRESGLPGPRGNLELMQAVADAGDARRFERYAAIGPQQASTNSPQGFLAMCGVVGLGRLAAEGDHTRLAQLRRLATDPRWRIREAVAIALQRLGAADMPALLAEMAAWAEGGWLEQRAVVAGLCEPALLGDPAQVEQVLALLDRITADLAQATERKSEDFIALRKGLAYGWSVAVVAHPAAGKACLERWLVSTDKDVRWIVRENLKKDRLRRMDAAWVEQCQARWAQANIS
ncbi:MAG: hypothetical protein GYA17_16525 [Chloroflexi bacterium]|nr:hypothetical protein [Chloroflexota bacterium]